MGHADSAREIKQLVSVGGQNNVCTTTVGCTYIIFFFFYNIQHILVTLLSLSVHTHTPPQKHTHCHTHQPGLSQSPSCLGNLSVAGRYNTLDLCCCVIDFPEVPVGAARGQFDDCRF